MRGVKGLCYSKAGGAYLRYWEFYFNFQFLKDVEIQKLKIKKYACRMLMSLLNIWCYCIYTSPFQASDSGVGREIREREKNNNKEGKRKPREIYKIIPSLSPLLTSSERLEQTMYRQIS